VLVRRRDQARRTLVLSLALHLEILALFLLILRELPVEPEPEQEPQGKGSPPSIAMVMDVGTAEGVKLPTPSFAPAKVAPGEAPSMAPPPPMPEPAPSAANTAETALAVPPPVPAPQAAAPPPVPTPTQAPSPSPLPAFTTEAEADPLPPPASSPAPPPPAPPPPAPAAKQSPAAARPAPQVMSRNTLPVPLSLTTRQPNRTANNQGASSDSPGPQAVNSVGAPPHSTSGPDPTTSTGGAAGEDGQPLVLARVARKKRDLPMIDRVMDQTCTGTLKPPNPRGVEEKVFPQNGVWIQAHFYRKPDSTTWITLYFGARDPINVPVEVLGFALSFTGQYGTYYTLVPSGDTTFAGTTKRPEGGKIDLVCPVPTDRIFDRAQ
jgi:hypothetical protein